MPDTINLKVYISNKNDPENATPKIKRFVVNKNEMSSYIDFVQKLGNINSDLKWNRYCVLWKDSDGDYVNIECNEDLRIALAESQKNLILKIIVTPGKAEA